MNDNYPNDWPCYCGHIAEAHGVVDVDEGGYAFNEDVGYEVWDARIYQHWICSVCDAECIYQPVDNLTYVEQKANEKRLPI